MARAEIAERRLASRRLVGPPLGSVPEVVGWLGAVQAQDYPGTKWALAQRTPGAADAEVDRAFNRGEILRTHVLRPTWHFVMPEDVRWMLALTAPRVKAVLASYDRRLELDAVTLSRGRFVGLPVALEIA